MESLMPPSYSNIFMGDKEQQILNTSQYQPLLWFQFINDIDMEWVSTEQKVYVFIQLATATQVKNGIKFTDLYCKPVDKHQ